MTHYTQMPPRQSLLSRLIGLSGANTRNVVSSDSHSPERHPSETQAEYRARQAKSRAIAKQARDGFDPGIYGIHAHKQRVIKGAKAHRLMMASLGRRQFRKHIRAVRALAKAV